jgi:hypothetical protein
MRGRYLKRNHVSEYPAKFIFFDTETYRIKQDETYYVHQFRLGYAIFWRRATNSKTEVTEHHAIVDISRFFDWVDAHVASKERLLLLAHNVQFDAQVVGLFDELAERGFKLRKFISDYGRNIWSFRSTDRTIIVADTLNWFKSSLKELGKSVGLEKMQMPAWEADDVLWREYCRNDVEILLRAMQRYIAFLESNDLGAFGLTLPAQAFNAYRHRFMKHKLVVYDNEKLSAFCRQSYYGGRCEAFKIGKFDKDTYYQLDVNSLYPSVMRINKYPTFLLQFTTSQSFVRARGYYDLSKCVADVIVKTDLPLVPLRKEDKLLFPVGSFRTTLAGPELKLAEEHGIIHKIEQIAVFHCEEIFREYVDFFYENRLIAKKNKDTANDYLHKLFLNSLSGKFGQRSQKVELIGYEQDKQNEFWYEFDVESRKAKKYVRLGGSVFVYTDFVEGRNAIPQISSFITSYARVHLVKLILRAGWENVFYVDTDSLIVNEAGFERLKDELDEVSLGKLKIEMISNELTIYGAKCYTIGDKVRMRGVRPDAELLDRTNRSLWRTYEFGSLLRNIASGLKNAVIERHFTKRAYSDYEKGIVDKNGNVIPFRFQSPS